MSKFDNTRQAIESLKNALQMNDSYLAGFLGVTEKSLHSWKSMQAGELSPKSMRLKRLFEVVEYLQEKASHLPQKYYRQFIENSRVIVDTEDEEEGSISLIGFINSEPENNAWVHVVKDAIHEYETSLPEKGTKREETPRSVQQAR